MLDHFLHVAYKNQVVDQQTEKLAQDLKKLPNSTLFKLAAGTMKLSFGSDDEWLEKYKGTELFEEAMGLEKADLEADIARTQAQQARPDMTQFEDTRDQIRMQKKMLDLKLVELQEQNGMQMKPGGELPTEVTPTAQGAGALGDIPSEGVQDSVGGTVGSKTGSVTKDITEDAHAGKPSDLSTSSKALALLLGGPPALFGAIKGQRAAGEGLEGGVRGTVGYSAGAVPGGIIGGFGGQALGRAVGGEKGRHLGGMLGSLAGGVGGGVGGYKLLTHKYDEKNAEANFQKAALDMKGLGQAALQAAKANPARVAALGGAAVGAAGGALAGGPEHRLSGALAGGALGAGAGHLGGAAHATGLPMAEGLQTAAAGMRDQLKAHAQNAMSRIGAKPNPQAIGQAQQILARPPGA